MATTKAISPEIAENLKRELGVVSGLISELLFELPDAGNFDEPVVAVLEKAGAITDRCISALGGSPLVGDFFAWCRIELSTAIDETDA